MGILPSETERGHWGTRLDFWLSCIGYNIGFSNIAIFPYLIYRNGGGFFLIPYIFFIIVLAIPVLFFELSLGQFCSQGIFTCWRCVPIMKGLGFAMGLFNFYFSLYFNILVAYCLYYLVMSLTSVLPWAECSDDTNSIGCRDTKNALPFWTWDQCRNLGYTVRASNANVCVNGTTAVAQIADSMYKTPAHDYWSNVVQEDLNLHGLENLGAIKWKIMLSSLGVLMLCAGCLSLGVKLFGKLVWVLTGLPLITLLVLLIRGRLLDGASRGVDWHMLGDIERLNDLRVWYLAAVRVFFSFNLASGGWITLGSYSRFKSNPLYISIIVAVIAFVTTLCASFMIFSFLGFLAFKLNVPVSMVTDSGTSLIFIQMADAIARMDVAPLWSILFYFMCFSFTFVTQLVLIETIVTGITDQIPKLRPFRPLVVAFYCLVVFLLGLTMTTKGGHYMFTWMDLYVFTWNIYVVCAAELFIVILFYGCGSRFLTDIESMVGKTVFFCFPWKIMKIIWLIIWLAVVPLQCGGLIAYWIYDQINHPYGYPTWATILGYLMTASSIVVIFVVAIIVTLRHIILKRNFGDLFRPSSDWGPIDEKDRQAASVLNPSIQTNNSPVDVQNVQLQMPTNYGPPAYRNQAYTDHSKL